MTVDLKAARNVTMVVPFLGVSDMERSVAYYVDGLGFAMTKHWVDHGKLRWCWQKRTAWL